MAAMNITEELIFLEKIKTYVNCFQEESGKFKCQVQGCSRKLSEKPAAI